jgi:hypothetical protein
LIRSWSWRLTLPLRELLRAGRLLRALATAWRSGLVAPGYYRARYPDVAASRIPPFWHYMNWGCRERRNPHPLFDAGGYLAQITTPGGPPRNPLLDYLGTGWRLGLNPHPLFNTAGYLQANPDVARAGINPLAHYLLHGAREGRRAWHLFDSRAYQLEQPADPLPELDPLSRCLAAGELLDDRRQFPVESTPAATAPETDIRLVAFYLPQYHRIPENDAWWGEGFTEWTNVRRGQPQFPGHYQPHVPHADTGYYDLDDPAVLEGQARIARQHGLHGFCYYFYWFNGKRLLERPLERMLHSGRPDFPFCLCWANENWTRRWDGMEQEILIAQEHTPENDRRLITAVLPFLRDRRCIRVRGRPLFVVYRPMLLPEPRATFERWRAVCREAGLGEIFLAGVMGFGFQDPRPCGLDALIQFPPHESQVYRLDPAARQASPDFKGILYDYRQVRRNTLAVRPRDFVLFKPEF